MKKTTEEELLEKATFNVLSKKMQEVCPKAILSFDIDICEEMKDYISDIGLDIEEYPDKATIIKSFNKAVDDVVDDEIKRLEKEILKSKKRPLIIGEPPYEESGDI